MFASSFLIEKLKAFSYFCSFDSFSFSFYINGRNIWKNKKKSMRNALQLYYMMLSRKYIIDVVNCRCSKTNLFIFELSSSSLFCCINRESWASEEFQSKSKFLEENFSFTKSIFKFEKFNLSWNLTWKSWKLNKPLKLVEIDFLQNRFFVQKSGWTILHYLFNIFFLISFSKTNFEMSNHNRGTKLLKLESLTLIRCRNLVGFENIKSMTILCRNDFSAQRINVKCSILAKKASKPSKITETFCPSSKIQRFIELITHKKLNFQNSNHQIHFSLKQNITSASNSMTTKFCWNLASRRCSLLVSRLFCGSWKRKFFLQVHTGCFLVGGCYYGGLYPYIFIHHFEAKRKSFCVFP